MLEFTSHDIFGFITLSMLEIVLGIDNLIFIALIVNNLPVKYRRKAQFIGISLALGIRVVMLAGASWLMTLTQPVLTFMEVGYSVKDFLMIAGGLFLLGKATLEMHHDIGGQAAEHSLRPKASFGGAVFQIALVDFVFSFDSVITAVGMSDSLTIMTAAVVVSMIVMLMAAGSVSGFLERNPTFKVLALSFILMIGMMLIADGLHFHIPRGYIYFAFAFAIFIEAVNSAARRKKSRQGKKEE